MTTVVLADSDFADTELERQELADADVQLVLSSGSTVDAIAGAAPDAEGLLVQWAPVGAALFDRLARLRVVGRYGTGVDTIDVDEATRRGIAVVNSGHYATDEVAAHAIALILALVRRVCALDRSVREGRWEPLEHSAGIRRLSAMRAGVIGLGHIGARVASHLQHLGFSVIGYDPMPTTASVDQAATLTELLSNSDVVTVHVPLTDSTAHLIDAAELGCMPSHALLVNTSRGGVVSEPALISALEEGRLSGAALDVFELEPLDSSSPLRAMTNVILTPHVAYYSVEALEEARRRTVRGVLAVLRGASPEELVNDPTLAARAAGR